MLGRCLAGAADPVRALRAYEAHRLSRTARMQQLARRTGTLLKGDNAAMRFVRDTLMRVMPASLQLAQLSWILGYKA